MPAHPTVSTPPPCAQPLQHGRAAAGCWRLMPGRALSLKPRQAGVLRIAQGRVWLTAGARLGDCVLEAGDALAIEPGQHVVMEPLLPMSAGDAPVLFLWDGAVAQPRQAPTRAEPSEWDVCVVQPLHELGRALATGARAVGGAAAQVTGAAARLGAGVFGFVLGRLAVGPQPTGKEVCIKNGCSA